MLFGKKSDELKICVDFIEKNVYIIVRGIKLLGFLIICFFGLDIFFEFKVYIFMLFI